MIRTGRRTRGLFIALASLALAGVMLTLVAFPAQAQGESPPRAPLSVTPAASHDSVVLSWRHQRPNEVDGYVILRWDIDEQAPGFEVLEENTGTTSTTYTDSSVEPDTRYIYQVKAINEHGISKGSRIRRTTRTLPDPTEPEQVDPDTPVWIGIDISPSSIEQGKEGRVTLAGTGFEAQSSYTIDPDVVDDEGISADMCEGWTGGNSLSTTGVSDDFMYDFIYTYESTISDHCPVGSYSLRVRWKKYNEDNEIESSGTFTRDFDVIPNSDPPRTDFERVDYITPLYPDPPATHDGPLIAGFSYSPSPSRLDVHIGIGGLIPDSDASTTDYVVSVRVVDEDNVPVEGCNQGPLVGGSFLIKTVPDSGMWNIQLETLSQSCASGLRLELLNGSSEYLSHRASRAAEPVPRPPGTNSPAWGVAAITGTARVGETLTADTSGISDSDGITNVSFGYQWIRNDGTTDTEITGATSTTYLVTTDDVGKAIKVRVSFTDDAGNNESLTSAMTTAVSATVPGAPSSVEVERGGTGELDVSWDAPDSNGGAEITEYTVQWKETADNWDTSSDVSSATTTVTSYTITGLSVGTEYSVRVIATNSAGDGPASAEESATAEAQTSQQRAEPQNTPATGAPTITGTAQVSETLTSDTSVVADEDGLDNVSFSYQWLADDTDIAGATTSTHTLTDSDEGRVFKVRVSFTDDAGNEESLTSAPLDPTRPYELAATVSNGAVVLTWEPPEVLSGLLSLTFYQILRNRPELGETEPLVYVRYTETNETSYTDASVEPGVLYVYRVKAADYFGRLGEASEPLEIRTPESMVVVNRPATGDPTIVGGARVGEELTADTSNIEDTNGLDNVTFNYQWIADDTDLVGATDSNYTLPDSDEGKAIRVRVSFTDDAGNDESLTSEATAEVAARPTNSLTASILDEPTNHDGENSFTFELMFSETPGSNFSYKTLRDHSFTATGGTVTKARRLEPPGNVRWEITVEPSSDAAVSIVLPETTDCAVQGAICTEDGRMLSAEASLTVSGPVQEEDQTTPENNPATGVPTISGTAQVGETLTADTSGITDNDGLTNATFTFQWLAGDVDIAGATGGSYTLTDSDEEKAIKVRVSFTDDGGNNESLTSAPSSTVAAAPVPLTSSMHQVPQSHDGESAFTFELRFSEEFALSYKTLRDHAFTVTGGTVTKARRLNRPSNTRWEITVLPTSNAAVTVELPVTTDCETQGAICTEDGRELSNSLNFTVSGPS